MKKNTKYIMFLLLIVSNSMFCQEELRVVTGKVLDLETQKELSKVKLSLFDADQKMVAESPVNTQGFYFFELEGIDNSYRVQAEAEGYTTAEVAVTFVSGNPTSRINFGLNKFQKAKNSTTKVKSNQLEPIYFDFNSSYLNERNLVDLDKIIQILRRNPTMRIEVRAHTDNRGSVGYNNWMSQRRAQRAADWIIKEGKIDADRVTTRDFGKDQPVHSCPPGVRCTEQNHRENRRCEFIIL